MYAFLKVWIFFFLHLLVLYYVRCFMMFSIFILLYSAVCIFFPPNSSVQLSIVWNLWNCSEGRDNVRLSRLYCNAEEPKLAKDNDDKYIKQNPNQQMCAIISVVFLSVPFRIPNTHLTPCIFFYDTVLLFQSTRSSIYNTSVCRLLILRTPDPRLFRV